MSSPSVSQTSNVQCNPETPIPTSSRKRAYSSVTNLQSYKRRRSSMASGDLAASLDAGLPLGTSSRVSSSKSDRFISSHPRILVPLDITPRTRRISKQFGLIDDRVLNFRDDTDLLGEPSKGDSTMTLMRRSASSLFNAPPPSRPTSVLENLNKRRSCTVVLDSPGVSRDTEAYPLSWSSNNCIAVACKNSVYYQNIDTRTVYHLCTTPLASQIGVIQWGQDKNDRHLAFGLPTSTVQVWDATGDDMGACVHSWSAEENGSVRSLSWHKDVLAIGFQGGQIHLTDVRTPRESSNLKKHRNRVLGLQWSPSGEYLASGDSSGIVHIWDRRNGKSLMDGGSPLKKLRHNGSTKVKHLSFSAAIAWCPWKPDLLATGSSSPEGKIQIWSISSMSNSHIPEPVNTIPLNTSVLSLHWSTHCKELLSTHGASFTPTLSTSRRRSSSAIPATNSPAQPKVTYTKTPLTNSIVVHEYPSCKRLMTLSNAHMHSVSHSCMSPNGENLFTVCPAEESIKMWQVWSAGKPPPKRESAFDKYTIR